jgi:hypothetical protein
MKAATAAAGFINIRTTLKGEEGLLGLELHWSCAQNGRFFFITMQAGR